MMWSSLRRRVLEKRAHALAEATAPPFRRAVDESSLVFDEAQHAAIARLLESNGQGFYLWGGVGRGKTMLSDLYFDAVPTPRKRRFHFHSFFRELQAEIAATREPVEQSIATIVGSAQLVLFDEFHVHDVADAVYLTKTLDVLLGRGIVVLATSNYAPHELLPNPLFHDRFLPAIAQIERRLDVVPLGPGVDYRRTTTTRTTSGFSSGVWTVEPRLEGAVESGIELSVNGLAVRALDADVDSATFTFAELCDRPLGTREYLALADDFDGIRLVDVPDLAHVEREGLMRLFNLVDAFYDRDQRLDVTAAVRPERILDADEPPFDADRMLSRLALLARDPLSDAAESDRSGRAQESSAQRISRGVGHGL